MLGLGGTAVTNSGLQPERGTKMAKLLYVCFCVPRGRESASGAGGAAGAEGRREAARGGGREPDETAGERGGRG